MVGLGWSWLVRVGPTMYKNHFRGGWSGLVRVGPGWFQIGLGWFQIGSGWFGPVPNSLLVGSVPRKF